MKTSILVSCYNQQDHVLEALQSCERQTYRDFEVLIFDDCSKDNSVDVIRNWRKNNPDIPSALYIMEKNRTTPAYGFNELLYHAKGEYFTFLHGDDRLLPDALEKLVPALDKTTAGAVIGDTWIFQDSDDEKQLWSSTTESYADVPLYKTLSHCNPIIGQTNLIRMSVIHDVGGFCPYTAYEDWDMWMTIACKYDILNTHLAVSEYRRQPVSRLTTVYDKEKYWQSRFLLSKLAYREGNIEESIDLFKQAETDIRNCNYPNQEMLDYVCKDVYAGKPIKFPLGPKNHWCQTD